MKCLSTNTISGDPCQRTVGRDGCPNHGNKHVQERLRQANRPTPAKPEQLTFPLSRDEIERLIRIGYESVNPKPNPDEICGCQG
jgi:hypothetical protein